MSSTAGRYKSDSRIVRLLVVTTLAAALILIRNFYRAVELSQGWTGYLISHEVYFCVLDGALMSLCVVLFNVIHPAWYLNLDQRNGSGEYLSSDDEITREKRRVGNAV